ncbi:hypothetical protein CTEN210_13467 [Chaetoceros tenuissimus]|uniref:Uncharacterized protein n=1 Tax=Chaetoceros tenuissimus TaxID=426638 RepID=A0AAD3D5D0_9STRA|nr:hypothetical protein CTEN210_13467 [Chaetoceros tenuissimus]
MDKHNSPNEAPVRKKSRVEEVKEYVTIERTDALTQKIQDLANEFPEMKYVLDLSDLQMTVGSAVVKYQQEVEVDKKRQENETNSPIYVLPDEMIANCFSYVKGSFLLVAPVSIKFCNVYKAMLKDIDKKIGKTTNEVDAIDDHYTINQYYTIKDRFPVPEKDSKNKLHKTTYENAAASFSTAKYCLENLSEERYEREKLFSTAALKGRLDVLKLANHVDILHFWDCNSGYSKQNRPIGEIAQAGHLHILQSLKDDFNMGLLLHHACRGAALGGQIHILKWLKSFDCLRDNFENREDNLCHLALWSGQVEALKWLRKEGFRFTELRDGVNMIRAIRSKNIEMISYCILEGFGFKNASFFDIEAIKTGDMNVVKFCFENGCEFSSKALSYAARRNLVDVCKYLRSKSLQWEPNAVRDVIESKSLQMLKFAHENGCEWSQDTWHYCMRQKGGINWDMMNYLHEKKCPWNTLTTYGELCPDSKLVSSPLSEPQKVVEFIISKKLPWGGHLLLESIHYSLTRATVILVENSPRDTLPESLSSISGVLDIDLKIMEYLYSKGVPFGEGFLKKLCGHNYYSSEELLEISKWALEKSYQIGKDEIYMVSCQTKFDVDILGHLYKHSELLEIEDFVKRCFHEKHYKKGFGSDQFQFFLNLGCPLTKSLTTIIFKCWISNPGNDILQDIVAILWASQHAQLLVDDIYTNDEESGSDESSDEDDDRLY